MISINTSFTIAVAALAFIAPVSATCYNSRQTCAPGCYNQDNLILEGGLRHCVAVGAGFYSPYNSDESFPCEVGQYSNDPEASVCQLCEPGSISGGYASTLCDLCPTGYYQSRFGQNRCLSCNPKFYNGAGSNAVDEEGYCALIGGDEPSRSPSAFPSKIPTAMPTLSPSKQPSANPTFTQQVSSHSFDPSVSPSVSPSDSPSGSPVMLNTVPSSTSTLLSQLPTTNPTETPLFEQLKVIVPSSNSPTSSPTIMSEGGNGIIKAVVGLISIFFLLFVTGFGFLYLRFKRSEADQGNKATVDENGAPVLIQVGGEFNQGNQMLDSPLETREEREFNDALDDIEAAMVADDWSVEDDMATKKGSLRKNNNNSVPFAQVIAVEYVDMKGSSQKGRKDSMY